MKCHTPYAASIIMLCASLAVCMLSSINITRPVIRAAAASSTIALIALFIYILYLAYKAAKDK